MHTYVLVRGGGHGGWCYERVARILRAAGHAVYAPTLTGLGERSHLIGPEIDLDLHIQDVVAVLHYEDLHDGSSSVTATAGWSSPALPIGRPIAWGSSCTSTPPTR
jgi:hypothetical protein